MACLRIPSPLTDELVLNRLIECIDAWFSLLDASFSIALKMSTLECTDPLDSGEFVYSN